MSDALRLTRHVPLTRVSPMAQYVASKGSTAWETSVKSRPEVIQDDFSPPGWRVVEKDKNEQSSENDSKKMPSGGLLSFFGRRATTPLIDGKSSRAHSPVRAPSKPAVASPTIVSFGSPRSSVDGTTPQRRHLRLSRHPPLQLQSRPHLLPQLCSRQLLPRSPLTLRNRESPENLRLHHPQFLVSLTAFRVQSPLPARVSTIPLRSRRMTSNSYLTLHPARVMMYIAVCSSKRCRI
jgi:hypothetical protein